MSYIERPVSRPKWFKPLLAAWLLTGMPVAIAVPVFWITGASPTEPPPPITSSGEATVEFVIRLVLSAYVFCSPILLAFAERNYRRRTRESGMAA